MNKPISNYQKRKKRDEQRVLDQIARCGGFSVFWVNRDLAYAIERLKVAKIIAPKRSKRNIYTWSTWEIV